jgi:hypothetical protein
MKPASNAQGRKTSVLLAAIVLAGGLYYQHAAGAGPFRDGGSLEAAAGRVRTWFQQAATRIETARTPGSGHRPDAAGRAASSEGRPWATGSRWHRYHDDRHGFCPPECGPRQLVWEPSAPHGYGDDERGDPRFAGRRDFHRWGPGGW